MYSKIYGDKGSTNKIPVTKYRIGKWLIKDISVIRIKILLLPYNWLTKDTKTPEIRCVIANRNIKISHSKNIHIRLLCNK
jgi:hypothetical protein